jgi:hypothetical protein
VPQDARTKAEFFPSTDKAQLIALGYIASRSAHSRGSTVDLAIVPDNARVPPIYDPFAPLRPCAAPKGERFEDGTVDFGTGYDCFDPLASTLSPGVAKEAVANRLLLQSLMRRAGFKPTHGNGGISSSSMSRSRSRASIFRSRRDERGPDSRPQRRNALRAAGMNAEHLREATDVEDLTHLLIEAAQHEGAAGCLGFLHEQQERSQPLALLT